MSLEQEKKGKKLEIVNEDGRVIGEATLEDCHKDPKLIHRAVHIALIDFKSRRVLMVNEGDGYNFLHDHPDVGKSSEDCVIKKLQDEFDYYPKYGLLDRGEEVFNLANESEFATFFVVTYKGPEILTDENSMWVSIDNPEEDIDIGLTTRYWMDSKDLGRLDMF